jgi:hypothetical protein
MVGGALAFGLEQQAQTGEVFAVPRAEGLEQLQAIRCGADGNGQATAIGCRSYEASVFDSEAFGWQVNADGLGELESFAFFADQIVSERVEREVARDG